MTKRLTTVERESFDRSDELARQASALWIDGHYGRAAARWRQAAEWAVTPEGRRMCQQLADEAERQPQ